MSSDSSESISRLLISEDSNSEFVPTGHFYSAVPSADTRQQAIDSWEQRIQRNGIDGIHINTAKQKAHFRRMLKADAENLFPKTKTDGFRYYFENSAYSYGDAYSLHAMLRHLSPKRLIEVGSGYSSAMTLDTVDRFLNKRTQCTFIEPYPERLHSLLSDEDRRRHRIIEEPVQAIDTKLFQELKANDVLFIDSTHVSKLGSDVNYLFFDVLPRLKRGVYVHIHDIFWPFDYPPEWIHAGRAWNEAYLLRALISDSPRYQICFFSHHHYLQNKEIWSQYPNLMQNPGAHLWLKVT